jgi:hypothetical protein
VQVTLFMPQFVSSVPVTHVPVVVSQQPVSQDVWHEPPALDPEPLASSPESSPVVASSPALPEVESPLVAPDGMVPLLPLGLPELDPEPPDSDPVVALPLPPPSRSVVVTPVV